MKTLALVLMLLSHFGRPRTLERAVELANVSALIAATDATETEAATLVAIAIHESRASLRAVGDGGSARGAWQVRGSDASVEQALRLVRWSVATCGDLSLYAGCGGCGRCPEIAASLLDPTLPRR
jgi:hypothetical protein